MLACLPAFLYTFICYILSLWPFEGRWKLSYGQPHTKLCILNNRPVFSMLVGINGPASLLLVCSIINFAVTLSFIFKSVRASKAIRNKGESERILLRSSLKLGLLLGLAWVLPMVAIWTNSRILGAAGNALLSTQGLFLALSLLLRENVKVLVFGSLRAKKNSPTSD